MRQCLKCKQPIRPGEKYWQPPLPMPGPLAKCVRCGPYSQAELDQLGPLAIIQMGMGQAGSGCNCMGQR
jgi:hypothetical protein